MSLKRICWVAIVSFWTATVLLAQPSKEAGKELFSANCASCHAKTMVTDATGPALAGVEERWADFPRTDLYKWIRGSQAMIQAGHPRAVELWGKYKPTVMNNFPQLTDEQIESLILYINDPGGPKKADGPAVAEKKEESGSWTYVGLALILGLLAFALMRIVNNLQNITRVQGGQSPIVKTTGEIMSTKGFVAFAVFALTLIFGYKTVDNATKMGRSQDYEPDQPIAFSHKIHAGVNKIDCQYCHDTARRSKHASIPATNTCMNCHAAVKKGTLTGTAEITKIYASIGYDPIQSKYIGGEYDSWSEKQIEDLYKKWIAQEYMAANSLTALDENGKLAVQTQWDGIVKALGNDSNGKIQGPIEWTRIHNLPDHAYFNHSQHVSVGQVACQKCHGPVETMDVVYQYSTLGMGWCINCHRETEVKFKDNAFYKQYNPEFIKLHKEKLGKDEDEAGKIKVEDIGGLECQKCHY